MQGARSCAPLVSAWIPKVDAAYGIKVTYGPIGSGGGINAITNRTVDFGASDAPLTPDQFAACKGCVQIPWALSATAIAYKGEALPNHLQLDGRRWSRTSSSADHEVERPGPQEAQQGEVAARTSPSPSIHRSDNSGTTYNLTEYLNSVSPTWKSGPAKASRSTGRPVWVRADRRCSRGAQPDERRHHLRRRRVTLCEPLQVRCGPEPGRRVRATRTERHRGGGGDDPPRRADNGGISIVNPCEEAEARLPDLHLHVRDRPRSRRRRRPRTASSSFAGRSPRDKPIGPKLALLADAEGRPQGVAQDSSTDPHVIGDARYGAGKLHEMCSPRPGPPDASTFPPAEMTTCLTIASPSPVPREARARSLR